MTPDQLSAYKHNFVVLSLQTPYMIIVAIVLVVALPIMLTKFPALQSDDHGDAKQKLFLIFYSPRLIRIRRHWRRRCWRSYYLYVGAQAACWSCLIRYAIERGSTEMTPGFAANYLTGTMVGASLSAVSPGLYQPLRAA